MGKRKERLDEASLLEAGYIQRANTIEVDTQQDILARYADPSQWSVTQKRKKIEVVSAGMQDLKKTFTFEFDGRGRLVKEEMKDLSGRRSGRNHTHTTYYSFDKRGRLTQEKHIVDRGTGNYQVDYVYLGDVCYEFTKLI